ncbi:MAG: phosphoribosylformylglycinamidine synthase subunit PurQ [Alphaproteobacteria bacterium]|nr:phosphoribosylformylglycinamidine synthase subunit PurQ [Alphaproteobacteria bacterium]
MKTAVIVFPGSNCDRDVAVALRAVTGTAPAMVWHGDSVLPRTDLIVLPGGFSYGDYLRCGAMAARSPVMQAVLEAARHGTPVLGICNGFQILTEAGLLPGTLLRNAGLSFVCRTVNVEVATADSAFTRGYEAGARLRLPIAHHDGNYFADAETLDRLEEEDRVAFRYVEGENPNGSARNIAGILSRSRTVLGLMPHPERAAEPVHPSTDGRALFEGLLGVMA